MANTPKQLSYGAPGTSTSTLYTVPVSTTTIVKNIVMCNNTTNPAKIYISVANRDIVSGYTVQANDTVILDLSLVMPTGQTITASQVTSSAINLFISGVEVA